ncbi:malto-oligosyltrehalose trehalohydrolase [Ancylothrix sp. C2]|uniref:malto-oligosyltrehalose trehalohydrolase n=1 Tax=Ancylothrix sp. D3o TaxID=2953691 RepID=UPI0021BB04D6|nr:malto-oligosyltrehalose trehalohydrolase [Ancylothrix sp. D3o]MCT7948934.1 malto-oligosyltrehalose trehalohydrolase [Ancylothrix sp. D3o]
MKIGASYLGNGTCEFTVWAPAHEKVSLQIVSPNNRIIPMEKGEQGYFKVVAEDVLPGTLYFYKIADSDYPDPASHYQPEGVHGPSQVIDHNSFKWTDVQWSGIPLEDMIIYELHVGTFTKERTFEAIIPRLQDLRDFGVNTIEIMPVAQFPGDHNWGYDGAYPFAVQNSYGGPDSFKNFIDAAHKQGISVILDVVYNHFGPEGNYISQYGPYFTEAYKTPWGSAINFDDVQSYGVRNYFIENALYWLQNYKIDGLRLDAIHAIYDLGAKHILQEMADEVAQLSETIGRKLYLIAESDLNDVRVIREKQFGGFGIDAQWNDDFHHVLHTLLTGEQRGYYQDYSSCEQLAKAYKESFVYSWHYSATRKRYRGNDASQQPAQQFVVCTQNHDQVGNRMLGERLSHLVNFEALKLAAGGLLLSPYVPLLFMGEEYGETSPFLYFVSHSDPDLVEAVRQGRKEEFADFHSEIDSDQEYSDPVSFSTVEKSTLKWELRNEGQHQVLLELYKYLIQLRRSLPALKNLSKETLEASAVDDEKLVLLHRWHQESHIFVAMNFNDKDVTFKANISGGNWNKILDSAEQKWMGPGYTMPNLLMEAQEVTIKPQSFVLYQKL